MQIFLLLILHTIETTFYSCFFQNKKDRKPGYYEQTRCPRFTRQPGKIPWQQMSY